MGLRRRRRNNGLIKEKPLPLRFDRGLRGFKFIDRRFCVLGDLFGTPG
jgi:hypothetical protein